MHIDLDSLKALKPFWDFLNSGFFSALLGAGFGAWGAHHIAQRSKAEEAALEEIGNLNVALALCFDICNSHMSLKKQMTRPMMDNYVQIKKEYEEITSGKKKTILSFKPFLDSFPVLTAPTDQLQSVIFGKINIHAKIVASVSRLISTSKRLNDVISARNSWLENHANSQNVDIDPICTFLGIKSSKGIVDRRYPDIISAIYHYNDDGIFFSKLACEEFMKLGNILSKKYKSKFHKNPPHINILYFDTPEAINLLPHDQAYESWLSSFRDRSEEEKRKTTIFSLSHFFKRFKRNKT